MHLALSGYTLTVCVCIGLKQSIQWTYACVCVCVCMCVCVSDGGCDRTTSNWIAMSVLVHFQMKLLFVEEILSNNFLLAKLGTVCSHTNHRLWLSGQWLWLPSSLLILHTVAFYHYSSFLYSWVARTSVHTLMDRKRDRRGGQREARGSCIFDVSWFCYACVVSVDWMVSGSKNRNGFPSGQNSVFISVYFLTPQHPISSQSTISVLTYVYTLCSVFWL